MSTIILTENANVAFHLKRCEQDHNYQKEGTEVWIPRSIYVMQEWVSKLAKRFLRKDYPDWLVLSEIQEHFLWYKIISDWQKAIISHNA
ncbi:hypothetical protein IJT17_08505, partial [bacterium]|nr:hypothetical protein [bacterium]